MQLKALEQEFTVCQIAHTAQIDFAGAFVFVSKTDDEISLVCESHAVPTDALAAEAGWKALKICGVLDFGMVGVIAKIAGLLAGEQISVFVVSTYNTDYILVKAEQLERAVKALVAQGYQVE
jgi:hypothetical protein